MSTVLAKVSELSSRVIRVLGCNPGKMTLQGTNTYLIGTGKKRILLDTGEPNIPEYISLLSETMKKYEISLESIIVTHWHWDHIGGIKEILKKIQPNCPVFKFPLSSKLNPEFESDFTYTYVADKEVLRTEGATLKLFHTPGHTEDHLVIMLEEENALFSGDCILGEGTAVFEDLHTYMKSLAEICELKPNIIYPGHGPEISDPIPKVEEYIKHRQLREEQIMKALQISLVPLSSMDLVKKIYAGTIKEDLYKAAENNIIQHLKKLVKENLIVHDERSNTYKLKELD